MIHWGLHICTTDTKDVSLSVQEGVRISRPPALYGYQVSLDIGITGVLISVQGLDIPTSLGIRIVWIQLVR